MKVVVVGSGYVGLVSGACFAEVGHEVICVDNNINKIEQLNNGYVPIFEPGLERLIKKNKATGHLKFSSDLAISIKTAEVVIIAVGTPTDDITSKVDLSFIDYAVLQINDLAQHDLLVIVKSTVPVGTCQKISQKLKQVNKFHCKVVSNPEFLREGQAIIDFMNPDRIVIGCNENAETEIAQLYQEHISRGKQIIFTGYETAELIKYASNTALAVKVALINEIASICEKVGGDINQVVHGVGLDSRIGNKFLLPGPGFGGSCFPKDVKALVSIAAEAGFDGQLIKSVITSNNAHKSSIVNNILKYLNGSVTGKVISILGLTYKANTDDVRCSPSIDIINMLLAHGAIIQAYDPEGIAGARKILDKQVIFAGDIYQVLNESSLAVIVTEWDQFRNIDYKRLKQCMVNSVIYDLRNVIDKNKLDTGIKLYKLGCASA